MQQNRFAKYAQPGPVYGPPPVADPYKEADDRRADRAAELAERKFTYDIQRDQIEDAKEASGGGESFKDVQALRKEFTGQQSVADLQLVLPNFIAALNTDSTPQGDMSLIYAFAKMMDPNSVVREGEFATAANTDTQVGQWVAQMQKEMGQGGMLRPDVRDRIRGTMIGRFRTIQRSYEADRKRFADISRQAGFDPMQVIGEDHVGPFEQDLRDAASRARGEEPTGGLPSPTESTFSAAELGPNNEPPLEVEVIGGRRLDPSLHAGFGDVAESAGDILGLVGNPLNYAVNSVFGTNLSTDLGQTFRDATGAPDGNPYASMINQGATAAMTGVGAASLARPIAQGATQGVLSQLLQQPGRQVAGGAGSGVGVQASDDMNLGPAGQIAGGIAGGLAGFGAAGLPARMSQPRTANPVAQAAERQGVQLMPADVGGPTVRRVTSAAAQAPLSASPVIKAGQRTAGDIESAVGRQTERLGGALQPDEAGEAVRRGGEAFIRSETQRVSRIYDKAGELAKGVRIKPVTAIQVIDEQIARLGELGGTNNAQIKNLQTLRQDIEGGVSVQGLRDARSALGGAVFDGKLRSTQEKQVYRQVLDAISSDIQAGLGQAGRQGASRLFRVADDAWRARIEQIDEVLEPIIGKNRSGEDILAAVERMGQGKGGGVSRLSRLMKELPENEANQVRGTILDRLGRSTAGQQNDTGTAFSPATFLTNWNKMSAKGKGILFGNEQVRQNLDDIAKIASATKEAQRYANRSNTAGGIWGNLGLYGAGGMIDPLVAGGALAGQLLTGRLMASPRFTRLLVRMGKNPNMPARAVNQELGKIAAVEPIIADDIASIQNFLGEGSYRAAASPEE